MRAWTVGRLQQLGSKGPRHWGVVALLILTGVLAGDFLGSWPELERARFAIYQFLQWLAPYEPTHARQTTIVLIDDKEYWQGDLARRVPLKRDYLARLLRKLDLADPAVIALDVDLRAQTPDGRIDVHPDYRRETKNLLNAIREVGAHRTIVLPQPVVELEEQSGRPGARYKRDATVFDRFDFGTAKVKRGYVSLPFDLRRVPLTLPLQDGSKVPSFAAAIVERLDPKSLQEALAREDDGLPFGTFMSTDCFQQVPAGDVLKASLAALERPIAHRVVIVGGAWHNFAQDRGPIIDERPTPAGDMVGAFIHGNYVEAIYLGNTKKPWPKGVGVALEILLSLAVAILFALDLELGKNLAITLGLCVILILLTLLAWQNLGLFFDFFVPASLLVGHALVEQVREWKAKAEGNEHHPRSVGTCAP